MKFSVKKIFTQKILDKWGKILEKSENFVRPEKVETMRTTKLTLCTY